VRYRVIRGIFENHEFNGEKIDERIISLDSIGFYFDIDCCIEIQKSRNVYLISQNKYGGFDIYLSAVVCANSADEARTIHPSGKKDWDGEDTGDWVNSVDVEVEWIGLAINREDKELICSNFR